MLSGATKGAAMFEIAPQVQQWRSKGLPVSVARVVSTRGFSSRDQVSVLAVTPDHPAVGQVFSGAGQTQIEQLLSAPLTGSRLEDVAVSDADAVRAGLACGGRARLLVQPASAIPESAWRALIERSPVCLVTRIDEEQLGRTEVIRPATLSQADDAVRRFFSRGVTATTVLPSATGEVLVAALWPTTTLVVVGTGRLADALVETAAVLGWTGVVVDTADAAAQRSGAASRSDVVVVLSHDLAVSGAALESALASSAGYIGALGSRHTQAARAGWMAEHGVDAAMLARINGPAGLDIGANTPGEVAISIIAEIITLRSGATGGRLADRPGPIHPPAGTPE
jgi:xanthine dehydrogenase accessory factor